jgi:hypothetical protein
LGGSTLTFWISIRVPSRFSIDQVCHDSIEMYLT